jgi:hypothetical protein
MAPEPFGMIIVTLFKTIYNTTKDYFQIVTAETNGCPFCESELNYRNSRLRESKKLDGEVRRFLLRRFFCKTCETFHTEIPNTIQPYKHYDSQTIQAVLDGSEDALACVADDSTIYRWKKTFSENEADIERRLGSTYAKEIDEASPISTGTQLLAWIRSFYRQWLAFVMAQLINKGHILRTQFAFCPPSYIDKITSKASEMEKGGRLNDKTTKKPG